MIVLFVIIAAVVAAVICFYTMMKLKFGYFERQGVIGPKPKFPYGNTKNAYDGKCNVVYDIDKIYWKVILIFFFSIPDDFKLIFFLLQRLQRKNAVCWIFYDVNTLLSHS